jgi:hypothetical protein
VRSAVLGLDLGDTILQRLIAGTCLGQLVVHLQRELAIALLQVELRHRLVDEGLRRRTGEHPVFLARFLALVDSRAGRRSPGLERFLVIRARARRAGKGRRRWLSLQAFGALGDFVRGLGAAQTFGAQGAHRRLRERAQIFSTDFSRRLNATLQTFSAKADFDFGFRRRRWRWFGRSLDRIVALESLGRSRVGAT